MRQNAFVFIIFFLALVSACSKNTVYRSEIEKWRVDHETDLKKEDGWLTVAGLFWLKDGINTVGQGSDFDISLTDNFKHGKFGEIDFHDGKATLKVEPGVEATVDGKPVSSVELASDDPGPATKVKTGSQTFYLIKREDRYGIRLKDSESPTRKNFAGEHWFPVDEKYRVTASFEPLGTPEDIDIPNVLGGIFKMKSP